MEVENFQPDSSVTENILDNRALTRRDELLLNLQEQFLETIQFFNACSFFMTEELPAHVQIKEYAISGRLCIAGKIVQRQIMQGARHVYQSDAIPQMLLIKVELLEPYSAHLFNIVCFEDIANILNVVQIQQRYLFTHVRTLIVRNTQDVQSKPLWL